MSRRLEVEVRFCEACGKPIERKRRDSGWLETRASYYRRRVCGDECKALLPIIKAPARECEGCGESYGRSRYAGGRLESWANYSKRRSCSKECRKQLENPGRRDPNQPGRRTIIAATCTACGDLKPGSKFKTSRRIAGHVCIACYAVRTRRQWGDAARNRARSTSRASEHAMQRETAPAAARKGYRWTGPELEILATRDDLSIKDLAVMLGRTYYATRNMRQQVSEDPRKDALAGVGRRKS